MLDLVRGPLRSFIAERMRRAYGERWAEYALGALHATPGLSRSRASDLETDLSAMLTTTSKFWHVAFANDSVRFTRTHLEEVKEFRNLLAHGGELTLSDLLRLADTVHRLLGAIGHADRSHSGRLRAQLLMQSAGRSTIAERPAIRRARLPGGGGADPTHVAGSTVT